MGGEVAMTNYAVFLLGKKHKEFISIKGYEKHLKRLQDTPNADPIKTPNNIILTEEKGKTIVENIKEYISKCKLRKNNVIVRDLLVTASREYFMGDTEKTFKWVDENMKFLREEFGENLRFAILHLDEETPHIHAIVCPRFTDSKGVSILSNDRYFGGKFKLIEWQNKYAKAMEKLGLTRGIEKSKAHHKDIKEFYAYVDHMDKIEDLTNIDPKFVMVENMRLKTRTSGLEETIKDYQRLLRLEKQAHQNCKKENEDLQKSNKDLNIMMDYCLDYMSSKEKLSKKEMSNIIDLAIQKGISDRGKEKREEIEYER